MTRDSGGTQLADDVAIDTDAIDSFLEEGVDGLMATETGTDLAAGEIAVATVIESDCGGNGRGTVEDPRVQKPKATKKESVKIPKGALRICLSKDRMRAKLRVKPAKAKQLTFDLVMERLRKAEVQYGLDEDAIIELIEQIPQSSEVELEVVIARGTPAEGGVDAHLTISALSGDAVTPETLSSLIQASGNLADRLDRGQIETVDESCNGLPVVRSGETAIELTRAIASQEGRDVCGKPIPVNGVSKIELTAAEGMSCTDGGTSFAAKRSGYLCTDGEQVWIASPVWIPEDERAAYAIQLTSPSEPLSAEELLKEAGVTLLPEREHLSEALEGVVGATKVSEAQSAIEGTDAHVEMKVNVCTGAGKLRADGSIDLKERNFASNVEPDTLVLC